MQTDGSRPADLADLADAVLELARHLDPHGPRVRDVVPLTGTEVAVIRQIVRTPRITPSQVATLTGQRRSNVSTAVKSLETRGFVVREHLAGDGRSVALVATELATDNIARLREFWLERLHQAPDELLERARDAAGTLAELADALAGEPEQ